MTNRVHALDLLRFFAAAAVVFYHYAGRPEVGFGWISEAAQFGYLGVPIFFIISGYVIMMSADGRTPWRFGVARAARLYPALWIGITLTVAVTYVFQGKEWSLSQILANATLLHDYMGQEAIDGVYWTLLVELKFYACVFLLMATGAYRYHRTWISIWLALTAIHSFTGSLFWMGWFISPSWSPFFIVGVIIYRIHIEGGDGFNAAVLIAALGLAAKHSFEYAPDFIIGDTVQHQIVATALTLIGAYLVLAMSEGKITVPASRVVTLLGASTYPLYLIHNEAGEAIIYWSAQWVPIGLATVVVAALVFLASLVICQYLERPVAKAVRKVGNEACPFVGRRALSLIGRGDNG